MVIPDSIDTVPAVLAPYLDEIETHLTSSLGDTSHGALPPKLLDAARYALLSGGKRLRPLLTVLSCRACGGDWHLSLPAAAATEYIHAFSLVHDDLPAMDDDDLRRGLPTVHRKFGEAMAILVGDFLQSLAFEFLSEDHFSPAVSSQLIRELADASTRMIVGQVYDTLGGLAPGLSDREKLDTIHRNKTGALIRAACRMGAIIAEADRPVLRSITTLGESVGLMFQIVDDLLDVTQSTEHLGKAAGKDTEAGKLTFPNLLGTEMSKEEISRLHKESLSAIEPFGAAAHPLRAVCDYLAVRTR